MSMDLSTGTRVDWKICLLIVIKPGDVGGLCGRGYFEGEGVALAGVGDQGLLLAGKQAGMDIVSRGGLCSGAEPGCQEDKNGEESHSGTVERFYISQ